MPQTHLRRTLGVCLLMFGILIAGAADAFAQSTFGTVLGTVTDSSGAPVANASVRITNVDEGTTRAAETDARGDYQAVNMKPARYRVEVDAQGFENFKTSEVVLAARQTLRVDASLTVGKLSEDVTVASAGAIATETQMVASTMGAERILNLPANFRASGSTSPYTLIATLPGVQPDNGNNFSIQGALPSQSQYSVDGISITDTGGNSPLKDAFPSAESLAEIKVQGVGNAAEYGPVGDMTTISKSGTNDLRGTAFWFYQNDALDAKPFGALTKPERTGNDYGVSVGGPLAIPNLYDGHGKTFFFGTFEGLRYPREMTVQNVVPTQAMRDGDLSREGVPIIDPRTGAPFAGNRIPSDRISPIAKKFLELYPLPNAGATDAQHDANYVRNSANDIESNQYDVRVDHYLSGKQSLFGRYTSKKITTALPKNLVFPSSDESQNFRLFVASHNYAISSHVLNEARVGLTRRQKTTENPFDGRSFTNGLGLIGIGPQFPFNGVSEINFSEDTSDVDLDRADGQEEQRTIQIANNLTWSTGRHTMKFGFDYRFLRATSPLGFIGADNYGNFDFSGAFTGSDFGDFLLGLPSSTSYAIVYQDNDGSASHYALFAQDNFHVGRNLTLEYGVRWEYHPAYEDASGNIGNFDTSVPRSGRVVYPTGKENLLAPGFLQSFNACPGPNANGAPCTPVVSAAEAGLPESLREMDPRIVPRFGFAYRPFGDDRTVIRGGAGAYVGAILGNVFYSLTGTLQSDVREFTNLDSQGRPVFSWPQVQSGGSGITTSDYGTASFRTANDIHYKDPYSVQWNLSVDRYLGANTGLRLSYIGMKTTQLGWAPNLNQMTNSTNFAVNRPLSDRPFPNWGIIYTRSNGATARYHAFQTEVNRRLSKGIALTSTYTLAKNLSDNGGPASGGFPGENGGGRSADLYNRGTEYGNDYATRRHRSITTAVIDLPLGQGRRFLSSASPVVNGLVGGWQMAAILLMQSGPHLTPFYNTGIDPSGSGSGFSQTQHPDRIGDGRLDNPTRDQWFDTSAFACPGSTVRTPCRIGVNPATDRAPIGRFGDAGVGIITGPGTFNLSLGVTKSVPLSGRARVEAGASFTNVLNHVNLADPNMNVGSSSFGRITSARTAELGGSRTGQITVRVRF
jgi:Carboxypeptidase regulatory-like domain